MRLVPGAGQAPPGRSRRRGDAARRLGHAALRPAGDPGGCPPGEPLATVPVPGGAVAVLAADGVDLEAAERRTGERRAKLESEVARSEAKLANDGFVSKAPAAVVDAERSKLTALRAELEAL